MAKFTKRIEMAHEFGVELQVARIDEFTTDNDKQITVIKTMGQPCVAIKDLSELAVSVGGNICFYEIERTQDYAKLTATGTHKVNGVPMYWMGNTQNGVFTVKPKIHYFSAEQAFGDMYNNLKKRTAQVNRSYARSVLDRQDLIKTSLYLSGIGQYNEAHKAFLKILEQQNQK
ncbi:MAG: hypothetical protein J6R22_04190 [Alphaproteobacteria bacterium]|nr:hypothetical protein [Alphaproteobacteria bacterium]